MGMFDQYLTFGKDGPIQNPAYRTFGSKGPIRGGQYSGALTGSGGLQGLLGRMQGGQAGGGSGVDGTAPMPQPAGAMGGPDPSQGTMGAVPTGSTMSGAVPGANTGAGGVSPMQSGAAGALQGMGGLPPDATIGQQLNAGLGGFAQGMAMGQRNQLQQPGMPPQPVQPGGMPMGAVNPEMGGQRGVMMGSGQGGAPGDPMAGGLPPSPMRSAPVMGGQPRPGDPSAAIAMGNAQGGMGGGMDPQMIEMMRRRGIGIGY